MPAELELPRLGLMRVRDPEGQGLALIDTSSPRVRAAYAERVQAWQQRTERDLRKAGVDRMDVPVPRERDVQQLVTPILRFFRMREQRGLKR